MQATEVAGVPRRRSLVPFLSAVLVCQAALYVGIQVGIRVPQREPSAARDWERRWKQSVHDPRREPALGTVAPRLALTGPDGKQVSLRLGRGNRAAVVFVGDGNTCAVRSLSAAWAAIRKDTPDLRVVLVVDDLQPDSGCRPFGPGIELAMDPDGQVAAAFNARWKPRAYLVDDSSRLAYAQSVGTGTLHAPLEIQQLLKREVASSR
jgi:hypothetical protein